MLCTIKVQGIRGAGMRQYHMRAYYYYALGTPWLYMCGLLTIHRSTVSLCRELCMCIMCHKWLKVDCVPYNRKLGSSRATSGTKYCVAKTCHLWSFIGYYFIVNWKCTTLALKREPLLVELDVCCIPCAVFGQ